MRLIYIISIMLITSAVSTSAQALSLGVETNNYAPYYYLNDEKKYQGAAHDIFDLFSKVSDLKISYDPMPVPRLFNELAKGNIDLKFPDNPLWFESLNSPVQVYYSNPIFNINESLMVLKENESEIAKEDIKVVGTILGFSVPGISKAIANREFTTVKTKEVDQLIHMLVSDRIQAVYFNENVAIDLIKKLYPDKVLIPHSGYPAFQYAYHLSSIKHPILIKQFNQFLNTYADQIAEIHQRYGLE